MSNITIGIAAEFKGKKAFNDASKSSMALEKQVKKLGRSLTAALSVGAITAFGKASVKAFAEDEKAAIRLAKVVDNLGLSFANPQITDFIDTLTLATGIADDKLRPALQSLLTTTGSVAQSQKLLSQAIDISAGSGVDLTTVTDDLAQAYVGNTRGLRKYNLGLTQAELKTASFSKIQNRLLELFSGSNAAFLDSYAGKMQVIANAAGEAQETIGKGLVDAIVILAGQEGSVQGVADAFQNLADSVSNVVVGIAIMVKKISNIPGLKQLLRLIELSAKYSLASLFFNEAEKQGNRARGAGIAPSSSNMHLQSLEGPAKAAAARKAEIAAAKKAAALAASLLKAQKNNTAELKKQALTKKQSALFDLDQIQLVAALKGNLSKEEELRVKLQLALLTGNTDQATKLANQLADSIDSTGKLRDYINTIPDAPNPFKDWDIWLANFTKNLATVTGSKIPATTGAVTPAASIPTTNVSPVMGANRVPTSQELAAYIGSGRSTNDLYAGQPIVVQIDGVAIATAVQNQGLNGNGPIVDRLLGNFK